MSTSMYERPTFVLLPQEAVLLGSKRRNSCQPGKSRHAFYGSRFNDGQSAGSIRICLIVLCLCGRKPSRQTERCHLRGCCQQGSPYFCCARHEQLAEDRREWPRCDERNADVVPGNSILVHVRCSEFRLQLLVCNAPVVEPALTRVLAYSHAAQIVPPIDSILLRCAKI